MPASNYLEDLAAQWYEYQGYFVRRNVRVGKLPGGGYECELDIVAFHPEKRDLVHIEPTMDGDSWPKREERYAKKFKAGQKYIPDLFRGTRIPEIPRQIVLIGYGNPIQKEVAGGKVMKVCELLREICADLKDKQVANHAVPESFPLIRGIQFMIQNRKFLTDVMS